MEHIRHAVELAKGRKSASAKLETPGSVQQFDPAPDFIGVHGAGITKVALKPAHLEANRIVAHDRADARSRAFDMLRTQVLQSMDGQAWQFLAVTSPTPGCGKTLTSVNLAISIARQPERSVLLVDMDMEKPQVANCLGLQCKAGLLSVLEGRNTLHNGLVQANIGNCHLSVLPCEASTSKSLEREYMTSRAMSTLLQDIKNDDRSRVVIFDLPPILASDNTISILPQMDCVLFVAAVGTSTASEIKDCNKHLQTSAVVRVVLNKVSEFHPGYYY